MSSCAPWPPRATGKQKSFLSRAITEWCARVRVRFSSPAATGEDLIQEGMFGLIQAIREYDADKAASFHTYAEICIRNRLFSALRAASRGKHYPLNESISLDTPSFDSSSYTAGTLDPSHTDPELLIAERDHVESLLESTRKHLSEFEAKILGYYLEGLSCHEIAKAVGKSPKSVDNAVQRVRRKAAQHIFSGDISKR